MQIPNTHNGERHFRELIRSLRINHKVPILSMREHIANGYFIAENTDEMLNYTASIVIKDDKLIDILEKKNSTRSPVGMRLLFDTIILCF